MKKSQTLKMTTLCVALLLSAPIVNIGFHVNASIGVDELDMLFQTTLEGILDREKVKETVISAKKDMIYDINLHDLGIQYRFEYGNEKGFAILIDNGSPKVAEVYMDANSPYPDNGSLKIYVTQGIYWYSDENGIYDCISRLSVSEEAIESVAEAAYKGTIDIQYSSERVDYIHRSETPYHILSSIPLYSYGLSNGCVPIAGSNLIAYYDKTYSELIPNYEAGTLVFGRYRFKTQNETTMALSETLHAEMGTNTNGAGMSVSQFKNGMKSYINKHGYSVSFQSLMAWGKFKFDSAKSVVQEEKAIALFVQNYKATTFSSGDNYEILSYEATNGNHAVAGFGCLEVEYTLADNTIRTDKYVHCSLGVGLYLNGYVNINMVKINDALAITIS